jgi:hypothetical protein
MCIHRFEEKEHKRINTDISRSKRTATVDDFIFETVYWKHFPASLKKQVSKSLAYADIMGVIKGSACLEKKLQPLSKEEYMSRRSKNAPNFALQSQRSAVYSLYESYESLKKSLCQFDNVDRVISVLRYLNEYPDFCNQIQTVINEIYVDGQSYYQCCHSRSDIRLLK